MARGRLPISTELNFTSDGLVLGAGTVIVPAQGWPRLKDLKGEEARVLTLLSAAFGKAVPPSVLSNIERATKAWGDGDHCLAYAHLAHARLQSFEDCEASAYRLFLADGAIKAGASPRAICEALHLDPIYIETIEKLYNPDESRVPAGSGRPSGEWTRDGGAAKPSLLSFLRSGAPWLSELTPSAATSLSEYGLSVLSSTGAAVAAFGLLFIPSPNKLRIEGEVEGVPGLRYSWNRDEAELHLTYDDPSGGQRTFSAYIDGDVFRDVHGRAIGRVLSGGNVAIDAVAVSSDLVKKDEPKLCPAPEPDVAGSDQGKPYEENRPRQYEDYMKAYINPPPDAPTPSGFVYYLPNPEEEGKPVSYDDCQKKTGILFEYKGLRIARLLLNPITKASEIEKLLKQAHRQVAASGGRTIIWIFAEEQAAESAAKLFKGKKGLEGIRVVWVPWMK